MDEQMMVNEIAEALHSLTKATWIDWEECRDEWDDEDSDPSYPVRLQLFDGDWHIWHGHPDFDSDHRGDWGSSFITQEMTLEECQSIAQELVDEALEMQAMSQGA